MKIRDEMTKMENGKWSIGQLLSMYTVFNSYTVFELVTKKEPISNNL